jgi:polyhydroxybutyrate depolymerase
MNLIKYPILISLIFCLLLNSCKSGDTSKGADYTLGPGDYDFEILHDGLERRYILYVPDSYDQSKPYPIVIAIHGGGGNADASPAFFQLNDKADQEGFIVAYPEGTGEYISGKLLGTWNGGNCCGYAKINNIDDVGFIDAMIGKIEIDFNTDTNRIYATGMSNGAIMCYRLACELSDKIAAIAPHSSIGHFTECNLTRSVPTLHIHGVEDPCASYDGCTECESCFVNFTNYFYTTCLSIPLDLEPSDVDVVSVPSFIDSWRIKNNCSDTKITSWQNGSSFCETYSDCGEGEVTLCTVDGGHTWSGRGSYSLNACSLDPDGCACQAWKNAVGPLSNDLIANDVIWEFFKRHSLDE